MVTLFFDRDVVVADAQGPDVSLQNKMIPSIRWVRCAFMPPGCRAGCPASSSAVGPELCACQTPSHSARCLEHQFSESPFGASALTKRHRAPALAIISHHVFLPLSHLRRARGAVPRTVVCCALSLWSGSLFFLAIGVAVTKFFRRGQSPLLGVVQRICGLRAGLRDLPAPAHLPDLQRRGGDRAGRTRGAGGTRRR